MSECKECKGKGWIFSGFGEDHDCETCFDKSPESENIVEQSQSDAWNDARTNPTECKVYETITGKGEVKAYQFWTGEYWGMACGTVQQSIDYKHYKETTLKTTKWREVSEWNEAGTKPDVEKVYETRSSENQTSALYQFWNGEWWASYAGSPEDAALPFIAGKISGTQHVQWREVQK